MNRVKMVAAAALTLFLVVGVTGHAGQSMEHHWQINKRERQDKASGFPAEVLELQSLDPVVAPTVEEAISTALKASEEAARPLIEKTVHNGRRLVVPDEFNTIQSAIDGASAGDVVLVKPGTYYELLVMKDGVKLVSDSSNDGNKLVSVEGARLKLPQRALWTVVDGSKAKASLHGMLDFDPGVGRNTVVDGFTFQNLPMQDHHIPGHAHALNLRGASPVIMNCHVRNNGSTGIGSHVVFNDQENKMPKRDLRWANVASKAEGVIYHNVVSNNFGLGIGCNHFSSPHILGNEVFSNDDSELGQKPSPGIGAKHGAAPMIIGNIIHDNPGGGILSKVGDPQGMHSIDRPTRSTVLRNVVYQNGKARPAISCDGAGSADLPVEFSGNFVYQAGAVGIGVANKGVGVVERNIVSGSGSPGIVVTGATALKLNHNEVTGAQAPGFLVTNDGNVLEMIGNASYLNRGPRFMLRGGTIAGHRD
jgi:hypothetical protein